MRIFIREYLGMLKEEKELESILIELVTAMGLTVRAKPQKGVRQAGVDLHAVGKDPEDGIKKNFIITIKQGNINREMWDSDKTSVRPSLNEINDVYIPGMGSSDKNLPIKIILCCGGELKQEVESNWNGFQNNNPNTFELWNGSLLSDYILKYLLNENIFIDEIQQKLKRTLVVLSDNNYDLIHFKIMINEIFSDEKWTSGTKNNFSKKALKTLCMIPVFLGLIQEYSNQNLLHPLLAAEYCLLKIHHFINQYNFNDNKKILEQFKKIASLYLEYSGLYINKIYPYCFVKDRMTLGCSHRISASEIVFKHIGLLGCIGLVFLSCGQTENSLNIAEALKALVDNNSITGSPAFDNLTIEITLAFILLSSAGQYDFIGKWINNIIERFSFSYVYYGKGFPIAGNSIVSLIEFEQGNGPTKEDMTCMSTLLPTLAYWCAVLNLNEEYTKLVNFVKNYLPHCTLQIWFPKKGIEQKLYKEYVGNEYGITEAPILLPNTLNELKDKIQKLLNWVNMHPDFESSWKDDTVFANISSRHFRNPINPLLWLRLNNN